MTAAVSPYAVHGWDPQKTASGDPRVPVRCDWCLGARVLLERIDPHFAPWELVPVVCRRCAGAGEYRRERRRS